MKNPFEGHPYRGGVSEDERRKLRITALTNEIKNLISLLRDDSKYPYYPSMTQYHLGKALQKNMKVESVLDDYGKRVVINKKSLAKDLELSEKEVEELIINFINTDWAVIYDRYNPKSDGRLTGGWDVEESIAREEKERKQRDQDLDAKWTKVARPPKKENNED